MQLFPAEILHYAGGIDSFEKKWRCHPSIKIIKFCFPIHRHLQAILNPQVIRGFLHGRRLIRRWHKAAARIQALVRGIFTRQRHQKRLNAAIRIQVGSAWSAWRVVEAWKDWKRMLCDNWWDTKNIKNIQTIYVLTQESASCTCVSRVLHWKFVAAPSLVLFYMLSFNQARIQGLWGRKKVQQIQSAILKLQRNWRRFQAMGHNMTQHILHEEVWKKRVPSCLPNVGAWVMNIFCM